MSSLFRQYNDDRSKHDRSRSGSLPVSSSTDAPQLHLPSACQLSNNSARTTAFRARSLPCTRFVRILAPSYTLSINSMHKHNCAHERIFFSLRRRRRARARFFSKSKTSPTLRRIRARLIYLLPSILIPTRRSHQVPVFDQQGDQPTRRLNARWKRRGVTCPRRSPHVAGAEEQTCSSVLGGRSIGRLERRPGWRWRCGVRPLKRMTVSGIRWKTWTPLDARRIFLR
ncbi:hypothetical protein B0H10DRAFT_327890 [Mycena sp. CBHHK59/15]|nr:hypothetical protein B0H10DRAFT_327890 [Mycena sp. CBHHK59/15]